MEVSTIIDLNAIYVTFTQIYLIGCDLTIIKIQFIAISLINVMLEIGEWIVKVFNVFTFVFGD